MGLSKIEWCDYTFNPWWGCHRVSPACQHCYADTLAHRWGHDLWHRQGPRRMMSDQHWREPVKWNRIAAAGHRPLRVFCASMADVFERHPVDEINAQLDAARARLWDLIDRTPHLRWLMLTKRPENVAGMVPWGSGWPGNVWLGTSVEDQRRADERIPVLLSLPARVRFLSCEPLLEPLELDAYMPGHGDAMYGYVPDRRGIDWVIAGGESGPKARPMHPDWVRSLRDQCVEAWVPFHFKQWGEWAPDLRGTHRVTYGGEFYPNTATCVMSAEELISRFGKGKAGRVLDGRTWDEYPAEHAAVTA